MAITFVQALDQALRALAPIDGVSIGRNEDRETWRIDFAEHATAEQRQAAQQLLQTFDYDKVLHNADIDAQIEALEAAAGGYNRGNREFMLGMAVVLDAARAVANGNPGLAPLAPAFPDIKGTPGMQRIRALDDAIKALRVQRMP